MKKNIKIGIFILIMFLSAFPIIKVNASYAYTWTVDGEIITKGNSNQSATASWVEDSNYTGGVLILNNYDGGPLKIECIGTGLGHVFAIKLVGDNKINADKGVGIIANEPVVFIGDGKLTINAAVPIGSGAIANSDYTLTAIDTANYNENTTVTIEPSTINNSDTSNIVEEDKNSSSSEIEETTTSKDDDVKVEKEENNSFLDSDLFKIVIFSYCIISLMVIIILLVKLTSKRKNI